MALLVGLRGWIRAARPGLRSFSTFASLLLLYFSPCFGASAQFVPLEGFVPMADGALIDMTVRLPVGSVPPRAGWPAVIAVHGQGLDKNDPGVLTIVEAFAMDRFVTLAYSVRGQGASTVGLAGSQATNGDFSAELGDLAQLKVWLLANHTVDAANIGITGISQGGLHAWSAAIDEMGFTVAAPMSFSHRNFTRGWVSNGSISQRVSSLATAAAFLPGYDSAGLLAQILIDQSDDVSGVSIPVLTTDAYLDTRGQAGFALDDYLNLVSAPDRMVYVGTGVHDTPGTDFVYIFDLVFRWLKYHLRGDDNGMDTEPAIHAALLLETSDVPEHITADTFPPAQQTNHTFYLQEGGVLWETAPVASQPSDTLTNQTIGFPAIEDAFALSPVIDDLLAVLPQDTVLYKTPEFGNDVVIFGFPHVTLYVDGTASRYQINVHLTDENPATGDSLLLSYGTFLVDKALNPAGATLDFDLSMTGRRVSAGHELALRITNVDIQETDPLLPYTEIRYIPYFENGVTQIFHAPGKISSVTVPIFEGSVVFKVEDVWVDFGVPSGGAGTEFDPFNSIVDAANTVRTNGTIHLLPGSSVVSEPVTINKAATVSSASG